MPGEMSVHVASRDDAGLQQVQREVAGAGADLERARRRSGPGRPSALRSLPSTWSLADLAEVDAPFGVVVGRGPVVVAGVDVADLVSGRGGRSRHRGKGTLAFMNGVLPPGPRAPRAVQMATWLARPLWFAQQCRARFGDTFTVRIEERPWVMLADPAVIREVFTAPADLMHAGDANGILRPMLGPSSCSCSTAPSTCTSASSAPRVPRRAAAALPGDHGRGHRPRPRPLARRRADLAAAARAGDHARGHRPRRVRRARARARTSTCARWSPAFLDRLTRVRRMVLIAALGPDSPRIVALFRRELGALDAELYRLIAERRTAPRPRGARRRPLAAARPRATRRAAGCRTRSCATSS